MIKAITLWQPWASLMVTPITYEDGTVGMAKRFETRSRPWNYRGFVAIHAAKIFERSNQVVAHSHPFVDVLRLSNAEGATNHAASLPTGVIVGIGWMRTSLTTCAAIHHPEFRRNRYERAFGDYSANRYAYSFPYARALRTPVPAKGKQGIWHWEPNEEAIQSMAEMIRVYAEI